MTLLTRRELFLLHQINVRLKTQNSTGSILTLLSVLIPWLQAYQAAHSALNNIVIFQLGMSEIYIENVGSFRIETLRNGWFEMMQLVSKHPLPYSNMNL